MQDCKIWEEKEDLIIIAEKKGLTLINGFFLVLVYFFNSLNTLIEKESLRKASVEELVKFKMFKELALFSNGPVLCGTVFLLLESV